MPNPKLIVAASVLISLASPSAAKSIRIYTQKVDAKYICGSEYGKNACSVTKKHMNLRQSDIPLERQDDAPNHFQVLGKSYSDLTGTAVSLSVCGAGDLNPFDAGDVSQQTEPAKFEYKKRSDAALSATLTADVKNALVASGVPAAEIDGLEAKFKASYKRSAGREHNIGGSYYRFQLKDAVIQALKNPNTSNEEARACSVTLREDPRRSLIYSIAVVKLDSATYASEVAQNAAADFAAKVKQKVPNADIAGLQVSISNAVKISLTVELGTEYRVISWDYLNSKNLI